MDQMDKANQLKISQLVLDIHAKQAGIDVCVREIKEDVKEHMRRTAQNETDIKWVKKHVFIAQGAISVIFLIAAAAGILARLGVIG